MDEILQKRDGQDKILIKNPHDKPSPLKSPVRKPLHGRQERISKRASPRQQVLQQYPRLHQRGSLVHE